MEAENHSSSFPMISERNWWQIRAKFQASVPSVGSPRYFMNLLSLNDEKSANSNVVVPMKRLGLLDENGHPTKLANDWRLDDEYKAACDKIIESVYPGELLDLYPDAVVDKDSAKKWFMSNGVGSAAARKMASLFALLKSGKVNDSPIGPKNYAKSAAKPIGKAVSKNKEHEKTSGTKLHSSNIADGKMRPDLHIDLQIHISPESTPEQIDAIFSSMAKHLYGVKS